MHVLGLVNVIELEAELIAVERNRPIDVADGQDDDFQGPVHERASSRRVGWLHHVQRRRGRISSAASSSIVTSMNGEKPTIASTS